MRRRGERGQAAILLAVLLATFLLGAVGLAIDGGQMWAHWQMAQNAADAAAQAGIMSIFNGTNTGANAFGSAAFTCTTGMDLRTPCEYARMNSFGIEASDTVAVDFPASSGVPSALSLIRVTVTRHLPTTFMRLLGPTGSDVTASATAGMLTTLSPVPIIVLDPGGKDAFYIHGNPIVTITGGPRKSIQVNSRDADAIRVDGSANLVDLSKAGPAGNGADFGNSGGPVPYPRESTCLSMGVGIYVAPTSPMGDPLGSVLPPDKPTNIGTMGTKEPLGNGVNGCPAVPLKPCQLYHPGYWAGGIVVQNETAVFSPGVYYMGSNGFANASNGDMYMCDGCSDAPDTVQGMLVYNTGGGTFDVGANASASLLGAPIDSIYKGMLFFNDREAASATHKLGGGGALSLKGTIYITNTKSMMSATPPTVQTILLQGNPGSETVIEGQIITSRLELAGNAGIEMRLSGAATLYVPQVALVK